MDESVSQMEPMLPTEGTNRLEDLVVDLVSKASKLAGRVHPLVQNSVSDLVRSMNCYYSNLIEGHDTHPRDIDRALHQDYSAEPMKRALQQEAFAHIEVQRLIDLGRDEPGSPAAVKYIKWLHREFCSRLPEELLQVTDPDTGRVVDVHPGILRDGDVAVGRHVPPSATALPEFLDRFEQAYAHSNLSRVRRILAIPAAHHRLLWIHPFLDGNGRVARLMAHAMLVREGVGSGLWSVSRGLARRSEEYKRLLGEADGSRRGDLDGRGSFSEAALVQFCEFFLTCCIDQIEFMSSILEPQHLLERIELWCEEGIRRGNLPRGSFAILREALLTGTVERSRVPGLTGYGERMARSVTSKLLELRVLVSEGHRAPLRLEFPILAAESWFPRLFPLASIR